MIFNPLIRTAYRLAHRGLRAWWWLRMPHTSGALAAIWWNDHILLVRNSYRSAHTLPGGYVHQGEDPRDAASRELKEEVGLRVAPVQFRHAYHGMHVFEHRHDSLDIYEADLDREPNVSIDGREVEWAAFVRPEEALKLRLVPHLKEYLEKRATT